jgi:5-methylcytosine-specific restriction endonuclease McrA
MTMENYGEVWHIDHTKPISLFNLTKDDEFYQCWNWKNLRPLLKEKNLKKHNKIDIYAEVLQEIKAKVFLSENNNKVTIN